jgi:hypothetical protein
MLNQGYRPPQQPNGAGRQDPSWNYPPGYGYPGAAQMQQQAQPRRTVKRTGKPPSGGGAPRAPKKRSLKWQLIKVLVVLVVLAGAGVWLYVWKTQSDVRPYTAVFLDNVYVDGLNLSGMRWEEANSAVQRQIDEKLSSWYVRLRNPAGAYKDITAQMLGISRDPTHALEQAWAIGHETSTQDRKTIFQLKAEIDAAKATRYDFTSVEQSGDTTPIDDILAMLERMAYVAPQDAAVLSFDPDNAAQPFAFQNEVVGKRLNVDALREQILDMVQTFTSGEVLVQPEDVQPKVTVASLRPYYALRFRAITPIDTHSTDERNNNIRVAFGKFNGLSLNRRTASIRRLSTATAS